MDCIFIRSIPSINRMHNTTRQWCIICAWSWEVDGEERLVVVDEMTAATW